MFDVFQKWLCKNLERICCTKIFLLEKFPFFVLLYLETVQQCNFIGKRENYAWILDESTWAFKRYGHKWRFSFLRFLSLYVYRITFIVLVAQMEVKLPRFDNNEVVLQLNTQNKNVKVLNHWRTMQFANSIVYSLSLVYTIVLNT